MPCKTWNECSDAKHAPVRRARESMLQVDFTNQTPQMLLSNQPLEPIFDDEVFTSDHFEYARNTSSWD